MANATTTEAYASLYTLSLSLQSSEEQNTLDALLDPETGYAPRLQAICSSIAHSTSSEESYTQREKEIAKMESETWDLIQQLVGHRLSQPSITPKPKSKKRKGSALDQSTLVAQLISSSSTLSELIIIREWLMDSYRANGPRVRTEIASRTGYWRATKLKSMGTPGWPGGQFDPDGPSRTGVDIHSEDVKADAQLCAVLYQLVRSGRMEEAYEVCYASHQPWRAASLRGGVLFAWPKVLRDARKATEQATTDEDPLQDAELEYPPSDDSADEEDFELGDQEYKGNLTRSLWKNTCRRIALNPSLPQFERLLYASLVPTHPLLPVLKSAGGLQTFSDALWITTSTLIEDRVEALLLRSLTSEGKEEGEDAYDGIWGDADAGLTPEDGAADGIGGLAGQNVDNEQMDDDDDEAEWEEEVLSALQSVKGVDVTNGMSPGHPLNVAQLGVVLNKINSLFQGFITYLRERADLLDADVSMTSPTQPQETDEDDRKELIQLLRFFTHLSLFLRLTGLDDTLDQAGGAGGLDQELVREVLESWVGVLEATPTQSIKDLIPLYTQALGENAIERYSAWLVRSFTEKLEKGEEAGTDEKKAALRLAEQSSLDPIKVAIRTAEKIVERSLVGLPSACSWDEEKLTGQELLGRESALEVDEEGFVRGLEWTLLSPLTFPIALEQSCLTIRYFLALGKLSVARRVESMGNAAGIREVLGGDEASQDPEQDQDQYYTVQNTTKEEYSDYLYFFQIWDLFDRIDSLRASLDSSASAASLLSSTQARMSELERRQTREEYEKVLDEVYEKLEGLLVRRVWLVDPMALDDYLANTNEGLSLGVMGRKEEERRVRELVRIRRMWVPEIVVRFVAAVLVIGGDGPLKNALSLVNTVSDSRYKIYEDFVSGGRLKDFLSLVQSAVLKSVEGGGNVGGDLFRLVRGTGVL